MATIFHLQISLKGAKPPIWRTIKVDENYRLDRLHQVIQIAMGWWNAHLHEFRIQERSIGMVLDDLFLDAPEVEDETKLYLRDFDLNVSDVFFYLYDFGDNWEHTVKLVKMEQGILEYPICTDGRKACPPEDCGGIWNYFDLLKILKNPKHPEYESYIEWLPADFDPQVFSIAEINQELKKFGKWHNKHPRAKSSPWHQI